MNTFYGKSVNTMTFGELTLLSVDIQLMSFEKGGITNERLITQSSRKPVRIGDLGPKALTNPL